MSTLTEPFTPPAEHITPIKPGDSNLNESQKNTLRLIQEGIADADAGRTRPGEEALRLVLSRYER